MTTDLPRPVRVLFFLEGLNIGGQQTYTLSLIRHLSMPRHAISVAFLNDGALRQDFEAVCGGVHRIRPPFRHHASIRNPVALAQSLYELLLLIRETRSDIVISNAIYSHLVAALACTLLRVKHVRLVGAAMSVIEPTYARYFHVVPLHRATHQYVGFPAAFSELRARGVPDSKLTVLPWAVDTEMFRPPDENGRQAARRQLGFDPDDFVIGWVGRISADMQVRYTVEMAARMQDLGFSRFRLLVVGDGPWAGEMRGILERRGLAGKSCLTGWQHPSKVPALMSATDVVPLLEEDPHGGSCVREAMAAARVVVSVDGPSGSQRSFITDGVTGVLVASESFVDAAARACIALAGDPERRRCLGEAARGYAIRSMSFSTAAQTFEAVCNRMIRPA